MSTAENIAKKFNVTKAMQDEYALRSIQKSHEAIDGGIFKKETVVVDIPGRNQSVTKVEKDECKMSYTEAEMGAMKPAFIRDGTGTVTAGNASSINDGAAALVLMSGARLTQQGKKPLAEILAWKQVGVDPMEMGIAPVKAVQTLMTELQWQDADVDLYELNEAFAVQSVCVLQQLGVDPSKVNVGGGAVALGHPIGASGARVLVTLLHHLLRLGKKRGIASLCIGGGMGIAVAVQICS